MRRGRRARPAPAVIRTTFALLAVLLVLLGLVLLALWGLWHAAGWVMP